MDALEQFTLGVAEVNLLLGPLDSSGGLDRIDPVGSPQAAQPDESAETPVGALEAVPLESASTPGVSDDIDQLRPEGGRAAGQTGDPVERANAVCRASVVLLVAHFESYLRSVAEELTDLIDSSSLESRQIPQALRELHTLPRFEEIISSNDAVQRSALLRKLGPMMALWNDEAKPPPVP